MKWARRSDPPEAPGWHFATLPGGLRLAHRDAERLTEAVRVLADAGWPGTPPPTASLPPPERPTTALLADEARMGGYEGEACTECGAMRMVRNGACLKCTMCGSTSGCS